MRLKPGAALPSQFPGTRVFSSCNKARYISPSTRPERTERDQPISRSQLLTLLHKTERFLPRVLPSPELWTSLLQDAYGDLDSQSASPAHVVVYGIDEFSDVQDLVTALLEEPFSSDQSQVKSIRGRWEGEQRRVTLHEGHSSHLRQYALPVRLTEIRAPPPSGVTHGVSNIQARDVTSLFAADIPVIVCNPLTTPLPTLFANDNLPWHNPRTILVILTSETPPPLNRFVAALPTPSPAVTHGVQGASEIKASLQKLKILLIDPKRAIGALNILKANPTSSTAIQRYQDDFLGSGVSLLAHALTEYLPSCSDNINPFSDNVNQRSIARLRGALITCRAQLHKVKSDLDIVRTCISDLEKEVAAVEEGIGHRILEIQYPSGRPLPKDSPTDEAQAALGASEREMKLVMDRLTWWRMISQVDEVGTVVGNAVSRAWCKDLDAKLLIHTGQLTFLQERLAKITLQRVSQLPLPASVLHNSLLQISSSPSYSLTQTSLTRPLHRRRTQIVDYPTTRLHLAAQRSALGVFSSLGLGASISWAGWVGWLVESNSLISLEPTTALGAGVLGALAGVRWAIGRWEKAKKRWWEDWHRVGDGLARDLKSNLTRVITRNVVIVPETASTQLLELVERRKNETADLEDELDTLEVDLKSVDRLAQSLKL